MIRLAIAFAGLLLAACGSKDEPAFPQLDAATIQSGSVFLTEETRSLQADSFANPGMLWVDRGAALFSSSQGVSAACSACHDGESMVGASVRYPTIDQASGTLINIEGRINLCRERHQDAPTLAYESENLLALTAYVAAQSNGMPYSETLSDPETEHFAIGETYFHTRRGQLNLSCSQCHTLNWGKNLRGDTISQGHGNGFPAYRLEWQSLGSLHRRFHDCDVGVRAEPMDAGSETYTALELYLRVRSGGLESEAPAVRR
ncbi:MAG: sulfur oxidation c-type cytochrome SoxA [Pseudomonadota bacterium]